MPRVGKFYVHLMPIQSVFQQRPVKTGACTHLPSSVSLGVRGRVNVHVCSMEINLQVASIAALHNCSSVFGGVEGVVNSGEPRASILHFHHLYCVMGLYKSTLESARPGWCEGPFVLGTMPPLHLQSKALMGRARASWFEDTLKARSFPETWIRNASGASRWKTHPLYANYTVQSITQLFKGEEYFRIFVCRNLIAWNKQEAAVNSESWVSGLPWFC